MTSRSKNEPRGPQHPEQRSFALEQPSKGTSAQLAGVVDRVLYHDATTGFSVIRIRREGHRELSTVVGRTAQVETGEWVEAEGGWRNRHD